ncbi:hypothetical protein ACFYQA_27475 [Streptomyces sp. NPDC005774]|uniref:hypothetical protein n=1 Tax=Streptomyces sp. NPDC005774 TaxID=3364728 RepID=UPI00369FCA04
MNIIEGIKKYSTYHLATVAEVPATDDAESAGSKLLVRVRDETIEHIEKLLKESDDSLAEIVHWNREVIQDAVADGAASLDTPERWRQFVDLAAYREDRTEIGTPTDTSLEGWAETALFQIAFRLVSNLLSEVETAA